MRIDCNADGHCSRDRRYPAEDQHAKGLQTFQRRHRELEDAVDDEQRENCLKSVACPVDIKINLVSQVLLNISPTEVEKRKANGGAGKPHAQKCNEISKLVRRLAAHQKEDKHSAKNRF